MLVKTDTVEPELIHELPGLKMLRVCLDRDVGLEVLLREGPRQLCPLDEMVQVLAVRQQIKDEDLHLVFLMAWLEQERDGRYQQYRECSARRE